MRKGRGLQVRPRTIHLVSYALSYGDSGHPTGLCTRDNFAFCLRHVRVYDELRYPDVRSISSCVMRPEINGYVLGSLSSTCLSDYNNDLMFNKLG